MTRERLRFIGGEMYGWSDLASADSAGGTARHLAEAHLTTPGSRVLVAGPHEPAFVRTIAESGHHVSWLMRSYVDANATNDALTATRGVQVLGGSLAKLPTDEQYDLVIALDGLGRLCSTEGVTLSWAESLDVLIRATAPGGTMLMSVDNPIGVHRLVQPDAWYTDRSDGAWLLAEQVDSSKPTNLPALIAALADSNLIPREVYGAFADPRRPAALITSDLLDAAVSTERRAAIANVVVAVSRQGWRNQPLLVEPQWLIPNAIRNGLASGVAASWVVVADRPKAGDGPALDGLPDPAPSRVIITDRPGADDWAVTYELTEADEATWIRRTLSSDRPMADGMLRRDPARLNGPLPRGETLEDTLVAICLRHDHVALRRLLMNYAGWLRELVGAGDPRMTFAVPSNVLCTDESFEIRDASWTLAESEPFDTVLAGALREFAVELLTGGYNHPWPSTMDADRLTIILSAIAGREMDTATIDRAVARQVAIRAVIGRLDVQGRRDIADRLAGAGSTSGAIDVLSFQRLRQAHARQADEIASLRDKLEWLDSLLVSREHALRRALSQVNSLSNSISFRVGRAVISPAILTRLQWRRTMRRLRRSGKVIDINIDDHIVTSPETIPADPTTVPVPTTGSDQPTSADTNRAQAGSG